MRRKSLTWLVCACWKEENVVETVNDPLRLNVFSISLELSSNWSIHDMVSDFETTKITLMVIFSSVKSSKGEHKVLQAVYRCLSVQ
jgi:hypothetical protein